MTARRMRRATETADIAAYWANLTVDPACWLCNRGTGAVVDDDYLCPTCQQEFDTWVDACIAQMEREDAAVSEARA